MQQWRGAVGCFGQIENIKRQSLNKLLNVIRGKFRRYYCRKTNSFFNVIDCEKRNDNMCWKYSIQCRLNSLLIRLRSKIHKKFN